MKHPSTSAPASRPSPLKNNSSPAHPRRSAVTTPAAPSAPPVAQASGDANAPCLPLSEPPRELRREEWDFTKLAEKDLLDCWKWEFQREMHHTEEIVRRAVATLRSGRTLNTQNLFTNPSDEETAFPWIADGLAHYPQEVWPESPYQCVDPTYRSLVFGVLSAGSPVSTISTAGRSQPQPVEQYSLKAVVESPTSFGNWVQWPEGAVLDSGVGTRDLIGSAIHREPIHFQCTVVALSLDWRRTDTELKASFARFLQAHRGTSRVLPNPERRGREKSESVLRTELKALAAVRLWRHCGPVEKAMHFARKSRPYLAFYQNERDWSAAKQRVAEVVAHLFEFEEIVSKQILGIPREPVAKRKSFQHMGK